MATNLSRGEDDLLLEALRTRPILWTSANVRARADRRRAKMNVNPWLVLLLLVLLVALVV